MTETPDYSLEAFQKQWPTLFGEPGSKGPKCSFHLPVGWGPLVWRLCTNLSVLDGFEDIEVAQVKEKFGGLRFYIGWIEPSEDVRTLINKYEGFSWLVCESCATTKDVETRTDHPGRRGWVRTQCGKCRKDKS